MKKIAVLDTNALANKGSYGRLEGIVSCLEQTIPGCKIYVFHRYFNHSNREIIRRFQSEHPDVVIMKHPWFIERRNSVFTGLGFFFGYVFFGISQMIKNDPGCFDEKNFRSFDALVDINFIEPDVLTEEFFNPSILLGNLFILLNVWILTIFNKNTVICSATIGPYNNLILRKMAKRILNKLPLITLREDFSLSYLQALGVIRPKILVTADLAFALKADTQFHIQDIENNLKKYTFGICPTAMMHSLLPETEYIQLMAEYTAHLLQNMDVKILFIANTYQDVDIIKKIFSSLKNCKDCFIVDPDISAHQTKQIIGQCDVFISSRFHALVASTSLGVPSIGIVAYSYNKFHGIIGRMMGQEEFLLNIDQDFDRKKFFDKLILLTNKAFDSRRSIREGLLQKEIEIFSQVSSNGELIHKLIENHDRFC